MWMDCIVFSLSSFLEIRRDTQEQETGIRPESGENPITFLQKLLQACFILTTHGSISKFQEEVIPDKESCIPSNECAISPKEKQFFKTSQAYASWRFESKFFLCLRVKTKQTNQPKIQLVFLPSTFNL